MDINNGRPVSARTGNPERSGSKLKLDAIPGSITSRGITPREKRDTQFPRRSGSLTGGGVQRFEELTELENNKYINYEF